MKQQQGFTLIELIMVIVILGILGSFALPRMADFGGQARTASVEGALGAVRSARAIAHAQSLADGSVTGNDSVTLEGTTITMAFGYPTAVDIDDAAGLDGFNSDAPTGSTSSIIYVDTGGPCFTYNQATSLTSPATVDYDPDDTYTANATAGSQGTCDHT